MLVQFDLFGADDPSDEQPADGKPLRKSRGASGWRLADHCCRYCFGRVLEQVAKGVVIEVRCAECGQRAAGGAELLCCCGADCGELGQLLVCVKNPCVTPEVPHEILVRERRRPEKTERDAAPIRPVKISGF
ncbi:hypothetical protein [Pararobbsia silviterrae]|uniref:Uncharacterized protein n=1 Tax=Pararobbsia silviterrae TaxID=1792498 RepID=A0A494X8L2_9BURK|nr:hypothetical protein [Pararobbsia silviterrae]RKP44716.1 hypothetical protein D7S86_27195 [Pararobbsia silviterrae]